MAGRRRGTGRPLLIVARATSRRTRLTDQLGRARSPVEQVTAACEYVRAELAALTRRDPQAAAALAAEVVRYLTAAGEQAAQPRK
jgi:DNA-binding GntR family transcriptional regulator